MTVFRKFCAAVLCALMPLSLLACAAPASSSTASPPASTAPTATPTAPAAPASTRSPQWEDPSGSVSYTHLAHDDVRRLELQQAL